MPCLQIPRTHIVDNRVSENIVRHIFFAHLKGVLPDDHAQLALVIQRIHQALIGRNSGVRALRIVHSFGKKDRIRPFSPKRLSGKAVRLHGVRRVVDAQAQHILLGARDRRQNLHILARGLRVLRGHNFPRGLRVLRDHNFHRILRDLRDAALCDQIIHIRKLG